jgi:hypothetical protein
MISASPPSALRSPPKEAAKVNRKIATMSCATSTGGRGAAHRAGRLVPVRKDAPHHRGRGKGERSADQRRDRPGEPEGEAEQREHHPAQHDL